MPFISCTSPECDEECDTDEEFLIHLKYKHKNEHDFKCPRCSKSFGYVCRLRRHFESCKSIQTNIGNVISDNCEILDISAGVASTSLNEENAVVAFRSTHKDNGSTYEDVTEVASGISNEDRTIPLEEFNPFISDKNNDSLISLTDGMYEMILKLLGKMSITKNIAFEVFNDVVSKIIQPFFKEIKKKCPQSFEELELRINKFVDTHGTEYKFRNVLKQKLMYFPATKFSILKNHSVGRLQKSHGYIFPIEDNIKSFFKIHEECLKEMITITKNLDNDNISTVIDSVIWKEKIEGYEDCCVIPINIYQDDIEINNPLGSKRGVEKISTVYLSFPLLGK